MAVTSIYVSGNSVNGPRNWIFQNYINIDEDISSPDSATVSGPNTVGSTDTSFLLPDMPADFDRISFVAITVRYFRATTDDLIGLGARIVCEADGTILAAEDAAGTHRNIATPGTSGTPTTTALLGFLYENPTATIAQWNDARLEFRQTVEQSMAADTVRHIEVDAVEVRIGYAPSPLTNSFEGGSDGTSITVANSGGTSGAPFDESVVNPAPTYESEQTIHGSLVSKWTTTTNFSFFRWYFGKDQPIAYWRGYYWFPTGWPGAAVVSGGSSQWSLVVAANGSVTLRDAAATTTFVTLSSGSVPLNEPVRIEVKCDNTGGASEVRVFKGTNLEGSIADVAGTGTYSQTIGIDYIAFGFSEAPGTSATYYLDEIAASDSDWLGSAFPPGPENYTQTVNDPLGLTDTVAATQATVATDALGLTDAIAPVLTAVQARTDALGLTDSISQESGIGIERTITNIDVGTLVTT